MLSSTLINNTIPDFKYNEIHIRSTPTDAINNNLEGEENDLMISFYLCNDYHEMKRSKKEEMIKSFSRLLRNCHGKYDNQYKSQQKKNSKKSIVSEQSITTLPTSEEKQIEKLFSVEEIQQKSFISFHSLKEVPIDISSLRNEDFQTGMLFNIFISPQISLSYDVIVNPPTVTALSTYPRSIYTIHCPIVANVSIENAIDYECLWYCEDQPLSNNYCFVSFSKIFIPSIEQIGCKLKLYCTAVDTKPDESLIKKGRSFVFYLIHPIQGILHKEQVLSRINKIRHHYHHHHHHHRHHHHPSHHTTNHSIHNSQLQESQHVLIPDLPQNTTSDQTTTSTATVASDLRILSYNILSEGYCQQERSIDLLYGYVKNKLFLETEYRLQRIAVELLSSSADIIGLQECDKKVYEDYLCPLLSSSHKDNNDEYLSFYSNKESTVREGCALFFRKSSFVILDMITLTLKDIFTNASFLQPLYMIRPDLQDILEMKLGTIAQLAIVQDQRKNNEILIVVNTHLFYHPLASYIRLLQIHIIIQKIEEIRSQIQQFGVSNAAVTSSKDLSFNDMKANSLETVFSKLSLQRSASSTTSMHPFKVSVIFMGDLNCTPGVTGLGYLENGKVDIDSLIDSWERLSYFKWGNNAEDTANESEVIEKELDEKYAEKKKEKEKENDKETSPDKHHQELENNVGPLNPLLFSHSLNLVNTSKNLQYTNFTVGFKNLLDYIFISRNSLEVVGQAPMPSIAELEEETAIPSSVFPSDHVSIGIDIVYK
jgi:mRNA deadenylase 3'-5' endonuclease subunit Ccr4